MYSPSYYPSEGLAPTECPPSGLLTRGRKKIGILGLGSMGKRHLKNFKELGCEVLGYDPHNPVNAFDRQYVINWADAIVIATPTDRHYLDIVDCQGARKPLFVEKPIAPDYNQLAIFQCQTVEMVGYNLRFHSCVQKARGWLAKGAIGKPLWARFTCGQFNDKPDYLRDGVLLNWSHELDLAVHLLGTAALGGLSARVTGVSEDLADLTLIHDINGCHSAVHLDYLTKWERRDFLIVGEYGSIEANLVTRQAYLRNNRGGITDTFYGHDSFEDNYKMEAKAFLDRLDGEDTLGATADEAMAVVKLCVEAKGRL